MFQRGKVIVTGINDRFGVEIVHSSHMQMKIIATSIFWWLLKYSNIMLGLNHSKKTTPQIIQTFDKIISEGRVPKKQCTVSAKDSTFKNIRKMYKICRLPVFLHIPK